MRKMQDIGKEIISCICGAAAALVLLQGPLLPVGAVLDRTGAAAANVLRRVQEVESEDGEPLLPAPEKLLPESAGTDDPGGLPIVPVTLRSKSERIGIKNHTSYKIDPESILRCPGEPLYSANEKSGEPLVLVIHTHGTETYTPAGRQTYEAPYGPKRTQDVNQNIVRVGREITEVLRAEGIPAVHSETMHDADFYKSYEHSLIEMEEYCRRYPGIRCIIDVHRDAVLGREQECLKTVCAPGGRRSAQVMLVVGTDACGLAHPAWRQNLDFAVRWQDKMLSDYGSLARPISISRNRYNQHLTPASLILEVGTFGNTMEEALHAARMAAHALARTLREG